MSKSELILFRVVPALCLTSAEVRALTAEDVGLLRELGADDVMLDDLRRVAQVAGQVMRLDFDTKTVTVGAPAQVTPSAKTAPRVTVN